jgi:glyoxylase-like metal-dependent hydrolase (beta-lactamase superfamily II)
MFKRKLISNPWFSLLALAVLLGSAALVSAGNDSPPPARSSVPAWYARGLGPLPWQGVSCLDLDDGGRWLAVGTIAPPGDPNVFLLDDEGRLVRTAEAGQRWLQQVAVDQTGKLLYALCTMPEGRAGDFPTAYICGEQTAAVPPQLGENGWPQSLFHYGAHSNHTGVILRGLPGGAVVAYGDRVVWLKDAADNPDAVVHFPRPDDAVTVALAAGPGGRILIGCTGRRPGDKAAEDNLFLLSPKSQKPLWSRPAFVEPAPATPPEKGLYGAPTLPDGKHEELVQEDRPVFAPLSLALDGDGDSTRIAAADYPGWQRWVRSSATLHEQNYGTRFVPARPTVSVYDGQGKLLRRFGPDLFPRPAWLDLAFFDDGKRLLAYPHHWTCRGLAGQTILPADDDARTLFVLDVEDGKVRTLEFPDAISDVSVSAAGRVVAGCWNGKVYILDEARLLRGELPEGVAVGGPSLVRISRDGAAAAVATTTGEVRRLDAEGKELWRKDLNKLVKPSPKPWVANARAEPIGAGVCKIPGGRVESDLGGQYVVEAPDGLILIEGHSGLSFDREWAAMKAVGLDPTAVKYVLATHEHGDHAPGAYLWRVVAGAQFVCSEEMADTLQHHLPIGTGYGLSPPVPSDIRIGAADKELDLAGLKVRALRLPGHTYGSMGWMFTKEGKTYVSFGDLIMPDGPLGYSGSVNFSARDVLSSLRKLQDLQPDVALPGHGAVGDPSAYIAAGIDVGVHVGWGKMRPEKPDPYFRLTQKNVQVVAWNIEAVSADFGDIDGDGLPDVAVLAPDGDGSVVKIYLNKGGKFPDEPDYQVRVPQVSSPGKIRLRRLGAGKIADMLVGGGRSGALLLSKGKLPDYDVVPLPMAEAVQLRTGDLRGDGSDQIAVAPRSGAFQVVGRRSEKGFELQPMQPELRGSYADFRMVDLNGDGRDDLVASTGAVYLRRPDGKLPAAPTQQLAPPEPKDWTFLAVGDFNGDGKPDVALLSYGMKPPRLWVYYNTGNADRPFPDEPSARIDLAGRDPKQDHPLLRDAPVVADWNGDGIDDLIIGKGQDNQVLVLLGGRKGLDMERSATIPLDYRLHYETGLYVGDFDGAGAPALACLGYTSTGVGSSGPLAVYIMRPVRKP